MQLGLRNKLLILLNFIIAINSLFECKHSSINTRKIISSIVSDTLIFLKPIRLLKCGTGCNINEIQRENSH